MGKYPDISHYHPVMDWGKVKGEVGFLISKATQGTSFVDSTLGGFIKGCEDNKIPYWLYTYLNKGEEKAQAEFMVSTCKSKVGIYFVGYILDIEESNTADGVKEALDYLNGLGVKTMIYTMYSQYDTYKSVISVRPDNCAWWEARYGANNGEYSEKYPCHDGVDLHQYTSNGLCAGVSGNCDLNRLAGVKTETWFKTAAGNAIIENQKAEANAAATTATDASKTTKLTVDGKMGEKTTKRAQEVFGTKADGKISNQLNAYKPICAGILSAEWSDTRKGGSSFVKALQKKIGATQDGYIGEKTIKKWQEWMGTTQDGKISNPSKCIKAFQEWLNKQ